MTQAFRLNTICRMDAIEGLKRLENESVDLVVTDPPYNIAIEDDDEIRHAALHDEGLGRVGSTASV